MKARWLVFAICAGVLFLAGCSGGEAELVVASEAASTIASETIAPAEATKDPIPSERVTEERACFQLLEPANDGELPIEGRVVFTWEAIEGAASFQVQTQLPNGNEAYRNSDEAQLISFMASLPLAGEYRWRVLAFDEGGEPICFSERFSFSKGEYEAP